MRNNRRPARRQDQLIDTALAVFRGQRDGPIAVNTDSTIHVRYNSTQEGTLACERPFRFWQLF
jgi:hypothetical protein